MAEPYLEYLGGDPSDPRNWRNAGDRPPRSVQTQLRPGTYPPSSPRPSMDDAARQAGISAGGPSQPSILDQIRDYFGSQGQWSNPYSPEFWDGLMEPGGSPDAPWGNLYEGQQPQVPAPPQTGTYQPGGPPTGNEQYPPRASAEGGSSPTTGRPAVADEAGIEAIAPSQEDDAPVPADDPAAPSPPPAQGSAAAPDQAPAPQGIEAIQPRRAPEDASGAPERPVMLQTPRISGEDMPSSDAWGQRPDYGTVTPYERRESDLEAPDPGPDPLWMSVLAASMGMLASNKPGLEAIGEGGLMGLRSYQDLTRDEEDRQRRFREEQRADRAEGRDEFRLGREAEDANFSRRQAESQWDQGKAGYDLERYGVQQRGRIADAQIGAEYARINQGAADAAAGRDLQRRGYDLEEQRTEIARQGLVGQDLNAFNNLVNRYLGAGMTVEQAEAKALEVIQGLSARQGVGLEALLGPGAGRQIPGAAVDEAFR